MTIEPVIKSYKRPTHWFLDLLLLRRAPMLMRDGKWGMVREDVLAAAERVGARRFENLSKSGRTVHINTADGMVLMAHRSELPECARLKQPTEFVFGFPVVTVPKEDGRTVFLDEIADYQPPEPSDIHDRLETTFLPNGRTVSVLKGNR